MSYAQFSIWRLRRPLHLRPHRPCDQPTYRAARFALANKVVKCRKHFKSETNTPLLIKNESLDKFSFLLLAGAKRAALYVGWSQARSGAAEQILN